MTKNIYFVQYSDLYVLNTESYKIKNLDSYDNYDMVARNVYLIKEDGVLKTKQNNLDLTEKVKAGDIVTVIEDIPYVIRDKNFSAIATDILYARECKEKENRIKKSSLTAYCSEECDCVKSL